MKKKKFLSILTALAMTVSLSTNVLAAQVSRGATSNSTIVKDSEKPQVPQGIQITNVTPNSGPVSGGTSVTITGRGFGNKGSVIFGVFPAKIISWIGDSITVTTPTGTVGAVDVTVTSGNGNSTTFKGGFTFTSGDTTAPVVTATPDRAANENGWYKDDVTVSFSAIDPESTITSVDGPRTIATEGKDQLITGSATNSAGLTGTGSTTISLDKTAPTIVGSTDKTANAAGWYNSDVTVSFAASDALSGVASNTAPVTLTEGANQPVTGTATDNAGNSASVAVSLNIDKTAPTITFDGITYTSDTTVPLGDVVIGSPALNWTATDSLSGLTTNGFGSISFNIRTTATVSIPITATDNAGNTRTITVTYHVIYNFEGILEPINNSELNLNRSSVPVKFTLTDYSGAYVSTAVASIYYAKFFDNEFGANVAAVSTSSSTTGNAFRYESNDKQYIFNMSTNSLTEGIYRLTITLDDGTQHSVTINLTTKK